MIEAMSTVALGRPYAYYVYGNNDTASGGAAIDSIATGLRWKHLRDPVTVIGTPDAAAREACWELGATTAASPMPGV